MYAIVEIAGQQLKVEKDQQVFVHRLEAKEGSKINFDKVFLLDNDGKINVGAPVIKEAKVTAKVLEHLRGNKIIVFKKKRRKGYKVRNGHRQALTKLEILTIDTNSKNSVKSTSGKKAEKKVVNKSTKKADEKKVVIKKAAKKTAVKNTTKKAAKKTAVKNTTKKKKTTKSD